MKTGLDSFLEDASRHRGRRLGVCCNHTAVNHELDHILPLLQAEGLNVVRLFGPEHGLDATAQDMIAIGDESARKPIESVSLYGDDEHSLHPPPETLNDLDAIVFDIQDIGARFYTYQATLGFLMQVAAKVGTEIIVLDRPNPIDGVTLEGNLVQPGFESFVSAFPLAVRHGMTMAELATFFQKIVGIDCPLTLVPCQGWRRQQWFDQTGLPWVFPSPNMPTLEAATLYPGQCLIEGTNLSEGRGTTRPFHFVGAPFLHPETYRRLCQQSAQDAGLNGVAFRAATFEPRFQKHAGQICHGVEMFITDRDALESFLLGMVVIEAALKAAPDRFAWRTETYEFVDDPIAIDLLFGSTEGRLGLENNTPLRELLDGWKPQLDTFREQREACLLYR